LAAGVLARQKPRPDRADGRQACDKQNTCKRFRGT
jgi:hypothetical protein